MWGGDGWAVVGQICGVWGQEWGAGGQNRRLEPWVKGGLGHSSGRGSSGGGDTGGAGGGVSTFGLGSLPPIAAIPFAAAPQRHRENCPPFPPLPPIPCLPFPTPVAPPFSPPHGHFLGCVRTASCSGMRRGGVVGRRHGGGTGRDGTGRPSPSAASPSRPRVPMLSPPPSQPPPAPPHTFQEKSFRKRSRCCAVCRDTVGAQGLLCRGEAAPGPAAPLSLRPRVPAAPASPCHPGPLRISIPTFPCL